MPAVPGALGTLYSWDFGILGTFSDILPHFALLPHGPAQEKSKRATFMPASSQGLTLLHFSAQRNRFLWNKGCS
jgi:hypothetical protein